jgi:hypothetical protein
MNFKSILVVGLSIATLGLSLPAHAGDTATVIENTQDAIVTGTKNVTGQSNSTRVRNAEIGRRNPGSTGTNVSNGQFADVEGKKNITIQDNSTKVDNYKRRTR